MRDFFQSCATFAFSISMLSLELADKLVWMEKGEFRAGATRALESVSMAAVDQLRPTLRSTFHALNDVQRGIVGITFDATLYLARNMVDRLADEGDSVPRSKLLVR